MPLTTNPEDEGNDDIFEPVIEALRDPVDGRVKRWRSLGYTTGGQLILDPPSRRRGIDLSWRLGDRDADAELSGDLYYLVQAARRLLDISSGCRTRREYEAEPMDTWGDNPGVTLYHLCSLAMARYLVTRRAGGGAELWVLER